MTRKSPTALIDHHVSVVGEIINSLLKNQENVNPGVSPINLEQQKKLLNSYIDLSNLELKDFIDALQELPILPILPDSDELKEFIDNKRNFHKAVAIWLRAMLLDAPSNKTSALEVLSSQEQIENETLKFTSISFSSASSTEIPKFSSDLPLEYLDRGFLYAELLKVTLNLARAVYVNSNDLICLFPSAEALWICCEFSNSRLTQREAGITSKPTIRSKRITTSFATESIENLAYAELEKQKKVAQANLSEVDFSENIVDLLVFEAARLHTEDRNFFDSGIYDKFLKAIRRFNNLIKNSADFQRSYFLPAGKIFTTGLHNKIPKEFAPPEWHRNHDSDEL